MLQCIEKWFSSKDSEKAVVQQWSNSASPAANAVAAAGVTLVWPVFW